MLTFISTVPVVPILAGAVAATAIGFGWYGFVWADTWRTAHGFSQEKIAELQQQMPLAAGVSFVGYCVTALILSWILKAIHCPDLGCALSTTALLWLGFPVSMGLMSALYAGASLTVFFIDVGYILIYMLAMATLLMVL